MDNRTFTLPPAARDIAREEGCLDEQEVRERQDERHEERIQRAVEDAPASIAVATAQEEDATPSTPRQRRVVAWLEPLFDNVSIGLYVLVALLLLLLTIAALLYAVGTIPENLKGGGANALTSLLSELLLLLILVELIRTIGTFITTRVTSVRPFLTIAIISSVRRILSVSAQLSLEDLSGEQIQPRGHRTRRGGRADPGRRARPLPRQPPRRWVTERRKRKERNRRRRDREDERERGTNHRSVGLQARPLLAHPCRSAILIVALENTSTRLQRDYATSSSWSRYYRKDVKTT